MTSIGALSPNAVEVETVYEGWSCMRVATFELDSGQRVRRHVEDHGRSACVLPYDPTRRCALLVRMRRAPVMLAGHVDLLEVPAGRCDEGEGPDAVRREALEEAGVSLSELELILDAWTMPAISAERSEMFIASYTSADLVSAGGGVAEEGEEIEVLEIPLDELWRRCVAGLLPDLKTAFLLYALRTKRPELFDLNAAAPPIL